ncbi:MAG: deoxyguanosinetriphosphate triphosphohydrolase [Tissierellia bacterium]|nr:deoxyguanosinetriphosphate triphosphohydrolase [Tissierellia bacterium]
MTIRERSEALEKKILSPRACLSSKTKGRQVWEEPCDMRTDFQRDRDRIIHSKAFRRLKHKTQVFISPEGDHYRTRLTHTLEVSQIARTMARALQLNEDLVEAIALGHDLGHTPFGHSGEKVLNDLHPQGFRHNDHSLRVVDLLESSSKRQGLNLTYEVREGIKKHTGPDLPQTYEGQLIRYADRFAYINHDIDDAVRAQVLRLEDLPKDLVEILGVGHSQRINSMIRSLVKSSLDQGKITMDQEVGGATQRLRAFMFETVYFNPKAKSEEEKISHILRELYHYYKKHIDKIPNHLVGVYGDGDYTDDDLIVDYIAGMSDKFALHVWQKIFVPKFWALD